MPRDGTGDTPFYLNQICYISIVWHTYASLDFNVSTPYKLNKLEEHKMYLHFLFLSLDSKTPKIVGIKRPEKTVKSKLVNMVAIDNLRAHKNNESAEMFLV